jgi:hypothetical protein
MKSVLTKKRRCIAETKDGEQCKGYRLSAEGIEKLLDAGISLVADPALYCSFHARTIEERFEMQAKGGAHSKKNVVEVYPEKDPMPKEIAATGYLLFRSLLDSKLPGTNESDARRVALGCYLASAMYTPAENPTKLLWELLPRDLQRRNDLAELAETQLRDVIDELSDEEQR